MKFNFFLARSFTDHHLRSFGLLQWSLVETAARRNPQLVTHHDLICIWYNESHTSLYQAHLSTRHFLLHPVAAYNLICIWYDESLHLVFSPFSFILLSSSKSFFFNRFWCVCFSYSNFLPHTSLVHLFFSLRDICTNLSWISCLYLIRRDQAIVV